MKRKIVLLSALAISLAGLNSCSTQRATVNYKPDTELIKLIDQNLKDGAEQHKVLMKNVPADSLPETFEKGRSKSITARNWVSGFYPGTLFYLYQATKDPVLYAEGLKKLPLMEPIKNLSSHDLGFMMFCSFGNANNIDPKSEYKNILLTSAQTLAKRFNPKVGATLSWSSKPGEFRVIIDNMMNLELLMWATKVTGDTSYAHVAKIHANTTMKNHFRPDYSSFHLVNYNPENGSIILKQTVQGYADNSSWARGQSWGLYGYTMMFRGTKNPRYLEHAKNIANYLLSHPNLPADKVPYWDYNAPDIPKAYRDASAASVMASALIELAGYDKQNAKRYLETSETIIRTLSSPEYKAAIGENGGFILKHGVGHLPRQALIDVPLTYGDYYFIEAMLRYKNLGR